MPRSLDSQLSYSGGEFSPLLGARVDHPKYNQACRQLQNMIALKQGGCTRRPGTIFKARGKYQDTDVYQYAIRLMKFQFSPTTSFILEFGHRYIRFYSNRQQVVLNTAPVWVNGSSYVAGNFVEDPADANNIYYCTQPNAGLQPPPSANLSYWTKQDVYEVPSPYSARDFNGESVFDLDVWTIVPCQVNDIVYLVHPSYPPYKLVRLADTNWTLTEVNFITPALLDQNVTGVFIGPSATTGNITLSANAVAWVTATYYKIGQSVNPGGAVYTCIVSHVSGLFATDLANGFWKLEAIFQAGQVGGYFQLGYVRNSSYVEIALTADGDSGTIEASGTCVFETFGTWSADVALQRSDDQGVSWATVRVITSRSDHNGSIELKLAGTALFRMVVSNYVSSTGTPRAVFTALNAVVYGLVRITGVSNAYAATAAVVSKLPSPNTTLIWSEGAWSVLRGFPQAVTSFQQRMIYGGTAYEPQRIWGSVTNDIENFALGDQLEATDSFAFDLAAVGRGPIRWLIGQVDLFCGFAGAEWIINAGAGAFGGSGEPITPQAINAGEHSAWGSAAGIPPALVGNAVIYPQRSTKTLQQMLFSVYTNKYMSSDLTSLSEHLFGKGVVQIDYQPLFRNQGIIWVTTKSGALCGMTYQLEQEVFAWHRHITGYRPGGGMHFFESVAVIDGTAVSDDEVWVAVSRGVGGHRTVELLNPENWETAGDTPVQGLAQPDIKRAIYVDSAITVTSPATNVISGLIHLAGESVIGLLNGNITFGPCVVQPDGTITIAEYDPAPDNVDVLQIGLPVYYAVQPMRLDADPRAGVLIGVTKALSRLYLRVFNSLSGRVGNAEGKETVVQYRPASTPLGSGPPLFTGDKVVQPFSTPGLDPTYVVQGNDPLPLTLLATTVRYGIEGSA